MIYLKLIVFYIVFISKISVCEYDLNRILDNALNNNSQIIAQKFLIEEKKYTALQANSWHNPVLNLAGGTKELLIGLSQEFIVWGKPKLRKDILDFDRQIEELKLSSLKLSISSEVLLLAYKYAVQKRKIAYAGREPYLKRANPIAFGLAFGFCSV